MPVVRVYLPVGLAELDGLAESGVIVGGPASPRAAFAVTDELARRAPGADTEALEFAAFADAVEAAGGAGGGTRRVVAALDADPAWLAPYDGGPESRVSLTQAVPVSRVASFHIDEADGSPGEAEADPADSGAADMLWYDVTELDEVRSLLG